MRRWWIVAAAGALALPARASAQAVAGIGSDEDFARATAEDGLPAVLPRGDHAWTAGAAPACNVTFKARNHGKSAIIINWNESRVRTRARTWKRTLPGQWSMSTVRSRSAVSDVRRLDLACDAPRRYDIAVWNGVGHHRHYYPSPRGFTQRTVIDLGDLSRFFR